ncbi:MAG TPA: glycoside hydrolase family 99-like domain-containing protein [Acidobacteriota bacterium]|nr:glycoside hydrolase family 99-like domain-containing protein [Acidobacteriota bacterium]
MVILMSKWLSIVALLALNGPCLAGGPYIVAAHYYAWYGGNANPHWPDGVAHRPWIGYYYSGDPNVARQQIDLAVRYGVNVFAVGWTGINTPSEKKFRSGLLKAPNLNRIRFCIVYDSMNRLGGEKSQGLYFDFNDPNVRQTFISDLVYLAQQYFRNPSYFKIQGRPVLKFYLARRFFGEFPSALDEARRQIRALGWDPYLVGDSLFYGRNDLFVISQFDAATAYNINSDELRQNGITTTGLLTDSIRPFYWNFLYQFRDILVPGRGVPVDLQPGVIPQFDSRKARDTSVAVLAQNKDEVVRMFRVARDLLDAKTSGPPVV